MIQCVAPAWPRVQRQRQLPVGGGRGIENRFGTHDEYPSRTCQARDGGGGPRSLAGQRFSPQYGNSRSLVRNSQKSQSSEREVALQQRIGPAVKADSKPV